MPFKASIYGLMVIPLGVGSSADTWFGRAVSVSPNDTPDRPRLDETEDGHVRRRPVSGFGSPATTDWGERGPDHKISLVRSRFAAGRE